MSEIYLPVGMSMNILSCHLDSEILASRRSLEGKEIIGYLEISNVTYND